MDKTAQKSKESIKGSRKKNNQKRDKESQEEKVRRSQEDDPGLMETMINKDLNGNRDQKGRGSQDGTSHKDVKKDERVKTKKAPFGWQCHFVGGIL